jgi:glycosyltransferase involved in cell wall biosynthesis
MIRQLNPNFNIVPNCIIEFPDESDCIAISEGPLRVFFGALNRSDDLDAEFPNASTFFVRHAHHIALSTVKNELMKKEMGNTEGYTDHQYLPFEEYCSMLNTSDVSIMPLMKSEFSACKSDLKLIEALAHGCVPLISEQTAEVTDVPAEFYILCREPQDWREGIKAVAASPDRMVDQRRAARRWVMENRSWAARASTLADLYTKLWNSRPALQSQLEARFRPAPAKAGA